MSCCVSRTSRQHRRDPWWHWEFVCFREASCSGGTQRRMARLWWQPLSCERIFVDFEFWLRLNSALYIFSSHFQHFFHIFFHASSTGPHCGNGIADADTMAGVQRCQLPQGTLMLSSHSSLAVLVLGWDRTTKITKSCQKPQVKSEKIEKMVVEDKPHHSEWRNLAFWDWHKCLRRWSTWKRRWMLVPLSSSHTDVPWCSSLSWLRSGQD